MYWCLGHTSRPTESRWLAVTKYISTRLLRVLVSRTHIATDGESLAGSNKYISTRLLRVLVSRTHIATDGESLAGSNKVYIKHVYCVYWCLGHTSRPTESHWLAVTKYISTRLLRVLVSRTHIATDGESLAGR